ncbi:5-hydroxytryptamine receptor 3A [Nothobranchius furzeri]
MHFAPPCETVWNNEYIQWNKSEFCEIPYIEVPAESLWKPDLTIEEMVENDKAPPVPYLCIYHNNEVELRNDQVVVSTCRMHVYKFPFDIQSCNLSFKSVLYPVIHCGNYLSRKFRDLARCRHSGIQVLNPANVNVAFEICVRGPPALKGAVNGYNRDKIGGHSLFVSDDELTITVKEDSKQLTDWSEKIMDSQYEWLFLNMSVTNDTVSYFGFNQTLIVYTVKMKRRSILYVANFLLPVLFFLFLDFASLLMSNSSGEKIGFKITVLLAVTVMQLILNDILPASSNRIPIIVIYCSGIFSLMLLSLLVAILVKYLIDKDSEDSKTDDGARLEERRGE